MDTRNTKKSEITNSVMIREPITPRRNAYPMHETPLSENVNSFWRRTACVGAAALAAAAAILYVNKMK
jgi:hypothetical protein